ncbi:beta,beta-carotene 15,15'-dioxygenase-like [Saccostrea cucullata]|uniref:beta,beta-carotene 15,15'-dioxygenase-like n=1 Tax=Saccostrea cuccullata TaxID=36930 RepID=UPI002ED3E177
MALMRTASTTVLKKETEKELLRRKADSGFDLFFASNEQEMENIPIYFKKPLPSWLKGTLIRNGLGKYEVGGRRFTHAFDAFAKLSSWQFPGNGTSFFSTKFLQSEFYKESMDKHDIAPYLLFESVDPPFNFLQRLKALVRGIDNMNVNVYKFGDGNIVALNDFWKVYQIDSDSLQTLSSFSAPVHVHKSPSAFSFLNFLSSAHSLPESGTSNHLTYLSSVNVIPGMKSKISLVRIKSTKNREIITSWEVDRIPYMHSFAATENYVIFFACPYYINVMKMIQHAIPEKALDWEPNSPTTLYVVHIKSGEVYTLKTDNVFMMHQINAFEKDNSDIIVDISSYPNPDFVENLEMRNLLDPIKRNQFDTRAAVRRYFINLNTLTVEWKTFEDSRNAPCASALDLPAINENYRYKSYCFAYGVALKCNNVSLSDIALVKKDLCGRGQDRMWKVSNHYAVEAWFIPTHSGKSEDDGYLVLPVLDGITNSSYLAFLNATTMEMVNSAVLPTIVPFNLHGRFFQDLI